MKEANCYEYPADRIAWVTGCDQRPNDREANGYEWGKRLVR